jgi:putative endonuclease
VAVAAAPSGPDRAAQTAAAGPASGGDGEARYHRGRGDPTGPGVNKLGEAFEALACRHLQAAGLDLLARNFATRFGELDLVMRERDVLVFVEVRYRARTGFGDGAASITAGKQAKLATAAEQFRQSRPDLAALPCRFDVVAMTGNAKAPTIDWLRGAFDT